MGETLKLINLKQKKRGFMYSTAIIDVHSRKITSWALSNLLDAESSLKEVRDGIEIYEKPERLNSYQGSKLTCLEYIFLLKWNNIKTSMDVKGRALENIDIERLSIYMT
jgi:putative transposase